MTQCGERYSPIRPSANAEDEVNLDGFVPDRVPAIENVTARLAEETAENQARLAELQAKAEKEAKAAAKAARAKFVELEIVMANAATPLGGEAEAHRDGMRLKRLT